MSGSEWLKIISNTQEPDLAAIEFSYLNLVTCTQPSVLLKYLLMSLHYCLALSMYNFGVMVEFMDGVAKPIFLAATFLPKD